MDPDTIKVQIPEPRVQIKGTVTNPDGTVIPFEIDTQPEQKEDGE